MTSVAVFILTYNEERHIARAISSVSAFADEVHIIDSFSQDRTKAISLSLGAAVYENKFFHQAQQFQWALDNIQTSCDWIMRLDADEVIELDLATSIRSSLAVIPEDIAGLTLDRKHIFMNKWIRHGGRYPIRLLRLFRRGKGRVEQRLMDEHILVDGGRVQHLKGGFADHNLNDLSFFITKHNNYSTREAIEVIIERYKLTAGSAQIEIGRTPAQAVVKRWVKYHVYNKMPIWAGPTSYFLFRYFVQLGFLDGTAGLVYHFMQGFWYRLLVAAKVLELELNLSTLGVNSDRLHALEELCGYKLSDKSSPPRATDKLNDHASSAINHHRGTP